MSDIIKPPTSAQSTPPKNRKKKETRRWGALVLRVYSARSSPDRAYCRTKRGLTAYGLWRCYCSTQYSSRSTARALVLTLARGTAVPVQRGRLSVPAQHAGP
eukprot:3380806-Rhodomonas_salina.2